LEDLQVDDGHCRQQSMLIPFLCSPGLLRLLEGLKPCVLLFSVLGGLHELEGTLVQEMKNETKSRALTAIASCSWWYPHTGAGLNFKMLSLYLQSFI
jgi:hypothetical protein